MNRPVIAAIGVCHRDVELAGLWLRWVNFLGTLHSNAEHRLLIMHTKRAAPAMGAIRDSLVGTYRGEFATWIQECPDENERGYPVSASHLFLRTLECAERRFPGHAVLWCESDTVPMKPTWFAEIAAEYQTCGKPFLGMRVGTQHPHLSGNAVYPADWRIAAPSIAKVLGAPDYKLWGPGKGQPWDVFCRGETTPQMAESKLMFQIWKERDARATRLKDIPERTCLFHQDKTGALIRELATARYPEFMANLNEGRRFFLLNGHSSRLRAKGVDVKFSYQKYTVGGWRSAVCSTELPVDKASALATLAGHFGLSEITEAEFCALTGRRSEDLPSPKPQAAAARAQSPETHPSVFVMLGRYGDICNVLPMLKAEADAGRRPTLVVSEEFANILDGVSYVDRIVWEGSYDRLPDALRWLKVSKGIPGPVVCQFHRHPFDKARLTDSYQKEVWRLAGRLDDFASRGPLVFDRREPLRETALVSRLRMGGALPTKPLILVGLESVSSPLKNANAILRAIVENYGVSHEIVNLSNVKAERIYDLIALFDAAACLVTADTAFLHLARASSIGVVALLNDGWRGSVPHEHVYPIRYAEATPERVLKDVASAAGLDVGALIDFCHELNKTAFPEKLEPGEDIRVREVSMDQVDITVSPRLAAEIGRPRPVVFHVVDAFGSDARHHVAQATWGAAYAEGMVPIHVKATSRDAKTELGDPRPLPFLKDVLQVALEESKNPDDVIVWSNSDIGFKAGAVAVIAAHVRQYGAASMRRTESSGKGHPGRDVFAFTAQWLRDHWIEFPDYVQGAPVFDLGLVAMIRRFHRLPATLKNIAEDMAPADMTPGYALHESHAPEWQVPNMDSVPSVAHNKKLFREWAKRYAPEIAFSKGGNFK